MDGEQSRAKFSFPPFDQDCEILLQLTGFILLTDLLLVESKERKKESQYKEWMDNKSDMVVIAQSIRILSQALIIR